jgi:PKHD-type hydroxylase
MIAIDPGVAASIAPNPRFQPFVCYPSAFSVAECAAIQALFPPVLAQARVAQGQLRLDLRASHVYSLALDPASEWIYRKLSELAELCNAAHFGFTLVAPGSALQLTEYAVGEFYHWHQDMGPGDASRRKLSASVLLSDPEDFAGGHLSFPEYVGGLDSQQMRSLATPRRGTAVFFPAYQPHRVEPVSRGVRQSLVGWFAGPPFA